MVMQDTIANVSQDCYDVVNKTFMVLQAKTLTTDGRNLLNKYFQPAPLSMSPPFNDGNVTMLQLTNFLASVYDAFQGVIQYTYDGRNNVTVGGLNVAEMCNILTSNKPKTDEDYLKGVVAALKWNSDLGVNLGGGDPQNIVNDYLTGIAPMQNVNFDYKNGNATPMAEAGCGSAATSSVSCKPPVRATTSSRTSFRSGAFSLSFEFYFQMCTDLFGDAINATYVRDHNYATQKYYGGVDYFNATNLVLPNGRLDPWHALGYYKNDTANHVLPVLITGTAHCSDMYPVYNGEPAALVNARQTILDQLTYFISSSEPIAATTTTLATTTKFSTSSSLSVAVVALVLLVERML
uniref:Serine carboxypeptidase n=1 Tax=Steinernema glaseri TaxID=37863 RepID=A0A1I7Z6M1_9BILA